MRYPLIVSLFLFFSFVAYAQYTVQTVPNTKLVNNSYVSDPDGILSSSTVDAINTILGELESTSTAQVAVVMLNSIGDEDIFDFAQELFVKWGIGQADVDNGLLILFVMDQRTIRFHTGFGLEGVLPDVVCKHIQQEQMIPYFREGNYDDGMMAGIQKVAELLRNPEVASEFKKTAQRAPDGLFGFLAFFCVGSIVLGLILGSKEKFQPATDRPMLRLSMGYWIFLYAILPISLLLIGYFQSFSALTLLLCCYGLAAILLIERYVRMELMTAPFKKAFRFQELSEFYLYHKNGWMQSAIFFPIPVLPLYLLYLRTVKKLRNGKRPCKQCGTIIPSKLSEKTEDAFLKPGQITEEKIGTIDYDVWKCPSCNAVELITYAKSKSDYTRCPQCNFLTYHLGVKRTLRHASYSADGEGESIRNCYHCGHQYIDKYIIPMLVVSSSSDSDSSSSSSDSDSGGSWGGGDSGGGGSSSSW